MFGCTVQVPIAPPQRTKMGPQRRSVIYIGFDSPSIIKYHEPLTGDVFKARFVDYHFDEVNFPSLGGDKLPKEERREIIWNASSMSHLDPRTAQCDKEVQKITHLQKIASQLLNAFTDTAKVTKFYILAANTPTRINIPIGKTTIMTANESSMTRLKHGRPLGSKDLISRKWKIKGQQNPSLEENSTPKEATPTISKIITPEKESSIEVTQAPKEAIVPEEIQNHEDAQVLANDEISINYASIGELWDRTKVVINELFCFAIATKILKENDDHEPRNVDECRSKNDWSKWKEVIQVELDSLAKRKVFGPVIPKPNDVKPIGYKWVFVRKRNDKNEISRYKACLVEQSFSQRPGIDYDETYSPVMDIITFQYLISMSVSEGLDMHLMDIITAYLYGMLENDIYMKVPEGFQLPQVTSQP